MAHDNTIDHLNHLVTINKDAETGFLSASKDIKNSELATLFNGYAAQHGKFAAELQSEVARRDGDVEHAGTAGGALHRGWMDLKAALTGSSTVAILRSCEGGEEHAVVAYDDALKANPTGQTRKLIDKQVEQIRGIHKHLHRLVGETEDGVEFQKNEV